MITALTVLLTLPFHARTTYTLSTMASTNMLLCRFSKLSLSFKLPILSSRPVSAYYCFSSLPSSPPIVTSPDGRQFAVIDMPQSTPKLKPYIVKRRLNRLRTYEGKERDIRHSPWRLNLVCQFAAGLPLEEALRQLEFSKKSKAPLVQKVLKRTANLADIRDGLQPSQLQVAECFATHGKHLKRMKIMGRGRAGVMHHRYSHMRVVLREIDFKLKIYQAPTVNQKKRWIQLSLKAEEDAARIQQEREELERLEQEAKAKQQAKEQAEKK